MFPSLCLTFAALRFPTLVAALPSCLTRFPFTRVLQLPHTHVATVCSYAFYSHSIFARCCYCWLFCRYLRSAVPVLYTLPLCLTTHSHYIYVTFSHCRCRVTVIAVVARTPFARTRWFSSSRSVGWLLTLVGWFALPFYFAATFPTAFVVDTYVALRAFGWFLPITAFYVTRVTTYVTDYPAFTLFTTRLLIITFTLPYYHLYVGLAVTLHWLLFQFIAGLPPYLRPPLRLPPPHNVLAGSYGLILLLPCLPAHCTAAAARVLRWFGYFVCGCGWDHRTAFIGYYLLLPPHHTRSRSPYRTLPPCVCALLLYP